MMGVLENMARLEKLEAQGQPTPIWNSEPRAKRPVVCHNCKQEGHYARGCAVPPARASRDQSKTPISLLPVSHSYCINQFITLRNIFLLDACALFDYHWIGLCILNMWQSQEESNISLLRILTELAITLEVL